jgi:hypothetical protein
MAMSDFIKVFSARLAADARLTHGTGEKIGSLRFVPGEKTERGELQIRRLNSGESAEWCTGRQTSVREAPEIFAATTAISKSVKETRGFPGRESVTAAR